MANALTYKQRTFTLSILSGKSGTQAALDAYNTHDANTAAVIAYENLRKPKIINEIKDLTNNDELLAQALMVIKSGLAAEKIGSDGRVNGPDFKTRLTAAEHAIRLCLMGY